ncbi:hypothetical protein, partial [Mycobacterium malmoense]|uniref:hypothetical protein n=1 Tax=Mycobacterium malmoense TaxID=1780 RepID=UPI001C42F13C
MSVYFLLCCRDFVNVILSYVFDPSSPLSVKEGSQIETHTTPHAAKPPHRQGTPSRSRDRR